VLSGIRDSVYRILFADGGALHLFGLSLHWVVAYEKYFIVAWNDTCIDLYGFMA
jgi:hypothetical protein